MKLLIFFCCIIFSLQAFAQPGDFIILKKNNKNLQTFYEGKKITFTYNDGRNIFGGIKAVKNDSLFIEQWFIQVFSSPSGLTVVDTFKLKPEAFAVTNIASIPNPKSRSQYGLPGALLMIGSGGYAALHVINNLTQKDGKIQGKNLLTAAGVFGVGALLTWLKPKETLKLGKKYKLAYVDISTINVAK